MILLALRSWGEEAALKAVKAVTHPIMVAVLQQCTTLEATTWTSSRGLTGVASRITKGTLGSFHLRVYSLSNWSRHTNILICSTRFA
jgi:hypothetical protein